MSPCITLVFQHYRVQAELRALVAVAGASFLRSERKKGKKEADGVTEKEADGATEKEKERPTPPATGWPEGYDPKIPSFGFVGNPFD